MSKTYLWKSPLLAQTFVDRLYSSNDNFGITNDLLPKNSFNKSVKLKTKIWKKMVFFTVNKKYKQSL